MNENTGNQARVLSDLRTAQERLAISHEVWMRVMPPVSTMAGRRLKSEPARPVVTPRPVEPRTGRHGPRVNLMGDHTDYNDGFCLPMAIDRECVVARGAGPTDGDDPGPLP